MEERQTESQKEMSRQREIDEHRQWQVERDNEEKKISHVWSGADSLYLTRLSGLKTLAFWPQYLHEP